MAKGKKFKKVDDMAEYILDIMENGNDEFEVNDSGSFLDWLNDYLRDIAYGD